MYEIIIITQLINIILIVSETYIVFTNMKNRMHYYLFTNCIGMLLFGAGYLMMLFSKSDDAYYMTLWLSWFGKVCVVISLLLFCRRLCEYKMPKLIIALQSIFALATFGVIITTSKTGLFYKNFYLERDGKFTVFNYERGPWYTLWNTMVVFIIVTCLIMLFKSLAGTQNTQKIKQYLIIVAGLFVEMIIGFLTSLPVGKYYDFNQLGFSICAILLLYAIFRNNLMDAETLAKEYIIDELSAGVIAMDTNGCVAYYNNKAFQIFPDIENNAPSVIEKIRNSIKTGEPITVEDAIYTFEERKLVHKSSAESKMYVLIDSTAHYQHLREVEREKQIADAANKAKTEFLASMSHEIRTPINAVLGMDEMILRESTEPVIKEYAMDIQASGRTLLTIINDILDLNKIESGKMEIVPVEYDTTNLLYDISNMTKYRAKDKELSFEMWVASNIPTRLFGDDVRIRQILMNLLTNAVKYTKKGTIWFRVSLMQDNNSELGENVILHFEVEDTGVGIKPEDMDKLFSEFERIDIERHRNIEGTGLGMPITMKLLSLMNSELKVESEYGKGSVFSFDLMQKIVDSKPIGDFDSNIKKLMTEQYVYTEELIAPDLRVLMVDDNDMNRKVFQALLKKTQIKIIDVGGGNEAIEVATKEHFDIIFMDHMMPGMDGVEAMKKIKAIKDGPCANTPIIVLTANAVAGAKEKYMEDGFDGFLSKPIIYNELEGLIKNIISKE